MTEQIADTFLFDDREFTLAGVVGGELFQPNQHDFNPVSTNTGCWCGFLCRYRVMDQLLLLDRLQTNHGAFDGGQLPTPEFGGRVPISVEKEPYDFFGFDLQYEHVALPIPFTGGCLIATDFIREFHVYMGSHPAWQFREVHELVFEEGRLTSQKDVSGELAEYRARFLNRNAPLNDQDKARIGEWIAETFSLKYDR